MTMVLTWKEMDAALPHVDVVDAMAQAFMAYSRGEAVIPPVGELQLENPPGDVHIKYGYLKHGDQYVVKIASGFYDNPALGLPSSQGLMLLFCQRTGQLQTILLDEGRLTDIRTGAAGALTVRQLAPSRVDCIGILGTGIQAREQLTQIARVHPCRTVSVWGRTESRVKEYASFARDRGFNVVMAQTAREMVEASQVIITTTPATSPLISSDWVQPGTHITAVGADTAAKQELEGPLLGRADLVVSDSLAQANSRGEVFQAVKAGHLRTAEVSELGTILQGERAGRTNDSQITIADLTGVAVQDLAIASAITKWLL